MGCADTSSTCDAKCLARLYMLMTPAGAYIGATTRPLGQRAVAHRSAMLRAVAQGRRLSPLHQALHGLEQIGRRPQLRLIASCTVTEAARREAALIAHLRATGMPLLNRSAGGDGGIVRWVEDCITLDERMLIISSCSKRLDPNLSVTCQLVIARESHLCRIIWRNGSRLQPTWVVDQRAISTWLRRRRGCTWPCRKPH